MSSAKQFGKVLNIDLNTGICSFSKFPVAAQAYFGGRGFNIWYLYHHLKVGINPLSPENILLISCGLLTGSSAPVSSRLHINALSPLTGILGSSNIGGYAGAWLRSCDIASIVITGKSEKPVYLYIDSKGAGIKDASDIWGQDAFETQDLLKHSYRDKKLKILAIGPGGENNIRFASIMTEKDHAAGRTGMGSVMGSKNLKAIVISKGNHKYLQAVTSIQKQSVKDYVMKIKNSSEFTTFSTLGGSGYVKWANDFGIMGSRNYGKTGAGQIEEIDGKSLEKNIVRSSGCFRCPVQCKAELEFNGTDSKERFTRPEFEPVINLGPKCGLNDIKKIVKLDNLCSRMGVDSTSAATAIAFAMDLFEKKLLPEYLVGDLDLSWGNAETMETLLYQMVQGKGLGKILGQGVRSAAEIIGNSAIDFAAHVKGLELTAYHPSAIMGTALGYAISSRGGDYNNVYASLEYGMTEIEARNEFGSKEVTNIKSITAKGSLIKKAVLINIIVDSLGLCKVPVFSLLKSFDLEHEIKLINGLSRFCVTKNHLFSAGEKVAALEKSFNVKHSHEDVEDTLPEMFFNKNGSQGLTRQKFKIMLQEYYIAMGWDENGIPPESVKQDAFNLEGKIS